MAAISKSEEGSVESVLPTPSQSNLPIQAFTETIMDIPLAFIVWPMEGSAFLWVSTGVPNLDVLSAALPTRFVSVLQSTAHSVSLGRGVVVGGILMISGAGLSFDLLI